MSRENNNFTKAVKELLGEKENLNKTSDVNSASEPQAVSALTAETAIEKTQAKVDLRKDSKIKQTDNASGQTYINAKTTINGSIITQTDIDIAGCVTGDVSTEKNIVISGKISGDIEGNIIAINGGSVNGNITARSKVTIDSQSVVIGDVIAETCEADGKIKGNLKINSGILLSGSASICGDIVTGAISIAEGATIKGHLQVDSSDAE